MTRHFHNILKSFFSLFLLGLLFTTVFSYGDTAAEEPLKFSYENVLILQPKIVYENAYNEQRHDASYADTQEMVNSECEKKILEAIDNAGLNAVTIGSLPDNKKVMIKDTCKNLFENSEYLIKGWKDKSIFSNDFALIKESTGCQAIFIQFLKVKLGASGAWDPNNGTILPSTNTISVKCVLLDLSTGKTDWSGASVQRDQLHKYSVRNLFKELSKQLPGNGKKKRS